jgi:hypothetical protein
MREINIVKIDSNTYQVSIQAQTATTHQVTVKPEYAAALLKPNESIESLVERSFAFLLQREPSTSILRSFDLSVIARYFPEYEREISK